MRLFLLLLFSLMALVPTASLAQQSSKSKSKSKLYEKGDENRKVRVANVRTLNSPSTDYSPAFYQNGLVYVSSRRKNGPQDKKTGETFFELYFAPFDPTGEPTTPENFSLEINSALHEGPVTFSRDFKTMFFTRNNMKQGVQVADGKGVVRLKIYEARRGKYVWENQRELPFNADDFSCMHPTLSADGQKLYFASDMPGGFGGLDLYLSERSGDSWGSPQNLGKDINTDKNEVFPFVHLSGTLFFASNGHNSTGGLDIFFGENSGADGWSLTNLGEPFNSPKDDLGIILDDDGKRGYFSSDRERGFGKDDIYSFEAEDGIFGLAKPPTQQVRLLVTNSQTGKPLQGASVRIFQSTPEGFVSSGNMDLYDVEFQSLKDGQKMLCLELKRKNMAELGNPDLYTNAAGEALSDLVEHKNYVLVVSADGFQDGEKIVSVRPDAPLTTLAVPLEETPNSIFLEGKVLTDRSNEPVSNANVHFTHKTSGKTVKEISHYDGDFAMTLPGDGVYAVKVFKDGFEVENQVVTVAKGQISPLEYRLKSTAPPAVLTSLAGPIQEGSTIILPKIYYDQNRSAVSETAMRQLEELIALMQRFPEMEIDLISHTDGIGEARANLRLSQERARHAKIYLSYRGIAPDRINALGRGESEPRVICQNPAKCTDEENSENRRTEVVVRKLGKFVAPPPPVRRG